MLVLGISGGLELVHENIYGFETSGHDSACVLIKDGKVVFAIEEERLNRIKHTNKFPTQSLHFCLKKHGIKLQDIDLIAYYFAKHNFDLLVVAWVQGRSEFGPRALGNRSILADPRPEENKERINKMIKKREGYRPFAPSVLEEEVDEFFEVPPHQKQFPFMVFVVNVREEKRKLLGAVTHIDGTARIQTVSRETNEKYYDLIQSFKKFVGVPVLLNTSFNNNVEPIVDSVQDAVVCFLTTELDYLVVGEYLVKKKEVSWKNYLSLKISLPPPHISLHQVKKLDSDRKFNNFFCIGNSYDRNFQLGISSKVFRILMLANSEKTVESLLQEDGETDERKAQGILEEIMELWSQRLILLCP
ncbi:carbamoyltransferase C-terminal domain-containing protein [Nostoc sp. 2RC]|uniref:carbamoyltransferase C-terminal domain-containing protein n=1 Tax=Nostoc sp. 2RC TaxID=2485484 RepID=UPI001628DDAD|nr:carbamoyltransferase C-terminal domain-containing protein [Nostoc sp. 2RC]MBC1236341.1 hypothetical protein [Nostoc sp. 2RC]